MTVSVVASVSTVGSKKLPPCAAHLPPRTTCGSFLDGVGDVRLDLLDRLCRSAPRSRLRARTRGDLHRPGGLGQHLVKASSASVKATNAASYGASLKFLTP